jgi:hypothetical protein
MNVIVEQKLARFVDREPEMRSFCRMLDEPEWPRPIMVVWGDGGMGKSALLLRMMHECSLRSLPKAEVLWTDTRNHDYLGVMRKIRDDVGAPQFGEFTKLVNFFTDPQAAQRIELTVNAGGSISVGESATLGAGAQVGMMAGVVIKDAMFVATRPDLGISDNERMARLTDQFILELDAAARERTIVVFLDATEKAAELTQRWIWGELLAALRDGRLSNVRFVIGGRNPPAIDEPWRPLIDEKQLGPLSEVHIHEYLQRRGIDANEATVAAKWLFGYTRGNPLMVASTVEAVLRAGETEARRQ